MLAFYGQGVWLASCTPDIRAKNHGNSDIRITNLIDNEVNPFNIVLCEDVYFDPVCERDLTLKLLNTAKKFLENRLNQLWDGNSNLNRRKKQYPVFFEQALKFLKRFFIGCGRMSFFTHEFIESQAVEKNSKKNVYYNIGRMDKVYKDALNNLPETLTVDIFQFG
jgi:hypothetical protein